MKSSPLKAPPLPQAGQSIGERIEELLYDKRLAPVLLSIGAICFAALEWARSLLNSPPRPITATIIAVVLLGYAVFAWRSTREELSNLRLGREGEQIVGHELEGLRKLSYEVFHDIPGEGFNIDHVLVGPGGVFTIETKTISKLRGNATVTYDGSAIMINGRTLDRDPLIQARAQARWLRDLIKSTTGEKVFVQPVVVFPEWFIEPPSCANPEVWVLNSKLLASTLRNRTVLSSDKAHSIAHHLRLHIQHTLSQIK